VKATAVVQATQAVEEEVAVTSESTEAFLAALAPQKENTEEVFGPTARSNYQSCCLYEDSHLAGQDDYCCVVDSNSYYSYFSFVILKLTS